MKQSAYLALSVAVWLGACAARDQPDPAQASLRESYRPSDVVMHTFYFGPGRWDIDERARGSAQAVAWSLRAWPSPVVVVDGYADTVGSPAAALMISRRRAVAVGCAILAEGAQTRIVTRAFGKTNLAVPTPDNTPELRNRRAFAQDRGAPADSTPLDPATCATALR